MSKPSPRAFTLVQLVFVVFVMAVMLRVLLHEPPRNLPQHMHNANPSLKNGSLQYNKLQRMARHNRAEPSASDAASGREMVALSSLGPEQGPLLARLIQRHRPMTTDAQVDDLVDTLPPSASPSVILLLPGVEKPETPPDHDKCAPHHEAEAEAEAAPEDSPRC